MRPRRLRRVVAMSSAALVMAGTFGGWTARADGVLNATEIDYINTYGLSVVCMPLNKFPTPSMVAVVVKAVLEDGFDPGNTADVVNGAVLMLCPQHWGLLTVTGEMARRGQPA